MRQIQLLTASQTGVQANAAAVLQILARNEDNQKLIAEAGAIPPLIMALHCVRATVVVSIIPNGMVGGISLRAPNCLPRS